MDENKSCFFCGSDCEIYTVPNMHSVNVYRCKYCGHYALDTVLSNVVPDILDATNKFKIACVLNERRLKGFGGVALADETKKEDLVCGYPQISVNELIAQFPQTAGEFLNRILLNLSRLASRPFSVIPLHFAKGDNLYLFTEDIGECVTILKELHEQGLIRDGGSSMQESCEILTSRSWEIIENWPAPFLCTSCYESISHVFSLS